MSATASAVTRGAGGGVRRGGRVHRRRRRPLDALREGGAREAVRVPALRLRRPRHVAPASPPVGRAQHREGILVRDVPLLH